MITYWQSLCDWVRGFFKLRATERALATAQRELQTTSIALKHALDEVERYRLALETSQHHEAEALRLLATKSDAVLDWFAQGCPRRTIYGTSTPIVDSGPAPADPKPIGKIHARARVSQETAKFLEELDQAEMANRLRMELESQMDMRAPWAGKEAAD